MNLVKTSFFSAIITFIKLVSGFVVGKIIATITGTSGVAIVGSFSNFITIIIAIANGATSNGIIKYTAENQENPEYLKSLFSTSLWITMGCSVIVSFLMLLFPSAISIFIFTTKIYVNVIRIFGISVIFYALNSLLLSILNGKNQIKYYTIANAIGSIISLIVTLILVFKYKILGALYSLVLSQGIVFFITVFLTTKCEWFHWSYFSQSFSNKIALLLGKFSLMAIVTAVTIPVGQLIIRNLITSNLGYDAAGNWQGLLRVSDGYLMIITSSLSIYYLPKLSSLNDNYLLKKEIFHGYKIFMPLTFMGCIFIYYARYIIINLFYTPVFKEMESLFLWQLCGDFFKIAAWILSYLMLAKAMTKFYIITEIVSTVVYVVLSYIFIKHFGVIGVTYAFAINYFVYLLIMLLIFKNILQTKNSI